MTYQEYYENLYQEYEGTSNEFLKIEKELSSTNGFDDFSLIPKYNKIKQSWQTATNNYWRFLSIIKGTNFSTNDEFVKE